ncbi:MAG: DinB family protein [Thermomicrobiales bacterium]
MSIGTTSTVQISQLVALLDSAFDGADWDSLLGNLQTTVAEDWEWIPDGGSRSIRDIVRHVGGSKFMYENSAFGDGSLTWDHPLVSGEAYTRDFVDAAKWLRDGHHRLREVALALTDADLTREVLMNWGDHESAYFVFSIMAHHDVYHAGEINLLRSLHHRDDRWAHERE